MHMAALCFGYFTSGERRPWHLLKRRLFFFVRVTVHCIYNVLINSSLLYGSETWRLTENNKRREQVKWYICISSQTHIKKNNRRVEATEVDALRRSSRISRKDRIRNVTIRQQIGLDETIIKEIEQNGRRKTTQNSIEVDAKTKVSTRKTEEKAGWKE